jgi:hypothetical protein
MNNALMMTRWDLYRNWGSEMLPLLRCGVLLERLGIAGEKRDNLASIHVICLLRVVHENLVVFLR